MYPSTFIIVGTLIVVVSVQYVTAFLPPMAPFSAPLTRTNAISSAQEHAKEIFNIVDRDNSGEIDSTELLQMLQMLSIDASAEEANALFKYLDKDRSGLIDYKEFAPWYEEAAEAATQNTMAVRSVLMERRTVESFDATPVSEDVLKRAIECAIRAPNPSGSEPWRFIQVGPDTARKIAQLRTDEISQAGNDEGADETLQEWMNAPGWCVMTSKKSEDPGTEQEDFESTVCAAQNFMLSMWSEGVGSQYACGSITQTKAYAELVGADLSNERVVGCVVYGFAKGGLESVPFGRREKGVEDVLSSVQ